MQTLNPSLFRWLFLCLLAWVAGCSAKVDCPAGFVSIAPGTFTMGSPDDEDGHRTDQTQHPVTVTRAFCMKATEVTQGEWLALMGTNPAYHKNCGANCPIEMVSWNGAVAFANALSRLEKLPECYAGTTVTGLDCKGYRLPTEAEWEFAARAGTTSAIYGGDLDSVAWYEQNSDSLTHPAGQKQANAWGLYDMLGNVFEWTGDWYDNGYSSGPASDPTGATTGSTRVNRGGSWYNGARSARAAHRGYNPAESRFAFLGFRLVRTAQ